MKKTSIFILFLSVCLILGINQYSYAIDRHYELKEMNVDVTGDHAKDDIILIGVKKYVSDIMYSQLYLWVHDKVHSKYMYVPLNIGGFDPKMVVKDINGDGVLEVLVSAATGGSGGTYQYAIYSFKNDQAHQIPVPKEVKGSGYFIDHYKAKLKIHQLNKIFYIDLKQRKEFYDARGIYKNGKLCNPVHLMIDGFSDLRLMENKNGTYDLKGFQKISGIFHYDTLGYLISNWKFENNGWKLQDLKIANVNDA